ncbi:MAG: arsenate reductase ArsC [Deltaproteobacteria bacterium]|nr:arsenate reductase ArsC [Deltaproteobacteria bacterium]MBW2418123.1 arsenate reductase ArsC [Deltaproteobacteria bacterium]
MPDKVYNTLFLCTGNSARSILAEAILNRIGEGRFRAFSAGSHPTGEVNPMALEVLGERGYELSSLRSKSWEEFAAPEAPQLDFVFTVCDDAAGEACPLWPGQPVTAHWGLQDPAALEGPPEERRRAFRRAYVVVERRIELFAQLGVEALEGRSLQSQLEAIGKAQPGGVG